jgi:hypothetical protein
VMIFVLVGFVIDGVVGGLGLVFVIDVARLEVVMVVASPIFACFTQICCLAGPIANKKGDSVDWVDVVSAHLFVGVVCFLSNIMEELFYRVAQGVSCPRNLRS